MPNSKKHNRFNIINKDSKCLRFYAVFTVLLLLLCTKPVYAAHNADGALDDPAHVAFLEQMLRENYVESMQIMTTEFTAVMMYQMEILGTLLDAKQQLETQLIFDVIEAKAHKEFHPSVEMCIIGTNVRHLAASERKYKVNAKMINQMMLDRELLDEDAISAGGQLSDKESRYYQFAAVYCDVNDMNTQWGPFGGASALLPICIPTAPGTKRHNADIDFTRLVDTRLTLDVDFLNPALTADEMDLIALTRNLFSHKVFNVIPNKELMQEFAADEYQDVRSVVAMRGMIRNSWGHIIGMKTQGSPVAAPQQFLHSLIQQIGVPATEVVEFIGQNPSYFAQMEYLTKIMYQSPEFYTNLYTKPVNVARTGVALQAIQLMHNRDRYEAALRKEMLVSMLLESKLRDLQQKVDNSIMLKVSDEFIDDIR